METQTKNYLMIVFIGLLILFVFVIYQYNEARNELVQELQAQGYTCNKNQFGFYKRCFNSSEFIIPIHLNFTHNQTTPSQVVFDYIYAPLR